MSGSRDPFELLVEPHRAAVRLHCYRMLGSSHDGDDMVQETLLRAYRARETVRDPAAVRGWLHRIATNVCLDEIGKRPRRARGPELGPPGSPDAPPKEATDEAEWLEPCPPSWLDGASPDPHAEYTLKESVALAFVAALQIFTPEQRAVLLLRDVVGLSARETADALGLSVSAANGALHRARAALEERVGPRARYTSADAAVDRELLERYLKAWQSRDLDAVVAVLHDDAKLSMPPRPTWIHGRAAIRRFLERRIADALRSDRFRPVPTGANACGAVAFYGLQDDGRAHLFAVHVLEVRGGAISALDHFMAQRALSALGLPGTIEG